VNSTPDTWLVAGNSRVETAAADELRPPGNAQVYGARTNCGSWIVDLATNAKATPARRRGPGQLKTAAEAAYFFFQAPASSCTQTPERLLEAICLARARPTESAEAPVSLAIRA
jgi:hypothetical protein